MFICACSRATVGTVQCPVQRTIEKPWETYPRSPRASECFPLARAIRPPSARAHGKYVLPLAVHNGNFANGQLAAGLARYPPSASLIKSLLFRSIRLARQRVFSLFFRPPTRLVVYFNTFTYENIRSVPKYDVRKLTSFMLRAYRGRIDSYMHNSVYIAYKHDDLDDLVAKAFALLENIVVAAQSIRFVFSSFDGYA